MKTDPQFYLNNNGNDTSSCGRDVFSACRTFPWLLGVFYNESYINSTEVLTLNLMLGTSLLIGPDILVRYITFDFIIKLSLFFKILIFTGRSEVVTKVIFLHLSVILFTGGLRLSACWDTTPQPTRSTHIPREAPPWEAHPPGSTPPPEAHPPKAPSPGSRLRHTVNKRPIRILLKCILV